MSIFTQLYNDKLTYDKMSMTKSHGGIPVNVFYQLNK